MSITSSKTSFGTQFKAHIVANRVARHLRLKKFGNKQKKEKVVQSILTSTVGTQLKKAAGAGQVMTKKAQKKNTPP